MPSLHAPVLAGRSPASDRPFPLVAGVATAILAIPQYLNVVETSAPTNGGAAGRNGAQVGGALHEGGAAAGAGERDKDGGGAAAAAAAAGAGWEPGKAGLGGAAGRRLETWQLLTAHHNGQCQLWHECSEGLRPVAIIGAACSPARRVLSLRARASSLLHWRSICWIVFAGACPTMPRTKDLN